MHKIVAFHKPTINAWSRSKGWSDKGSGGGGGGGLGREGEGVNKGENTMDD